MRALAVKFGVIKALKARISDLEQEIRAGFLETLDVGDSKAATLEDGTRLGKVTKVRGRTSPVVLDEAKFLRWVEKNHPSEVARNVRTAFQHKVLESAKRHGEAVDEATGEIIPGIGYVHSDPYISYRSERGAEQIIADRWHEIAGPSLLDGVQ